jgi:hypothetical protein
MYGPFPAPVCLQALLKRLRSTLAVLPQEEEGKQELQVQVELHRRVLRHPLLLLEMIVPAVVRLQITRVVPTLTCTLSQPQHNQHTVVPRMDWVIHTLIPPLRSSLIMALVWVLPRRYRRNTSPPQWYHLLLNDPAPMRHGTLTGAAAVWETILPCTRRALMSMNTTPCS